MKTMENFLYQHNEYNKMLILTKGKLGVWAGDILIHTLVSGDALGYSDLLKVRVSFFLKHFSFFRDLSIWVRSVLNLKNVSV